GVLLRSRPPSGPRRSSPGGGGAHEHLLRREPRERTREVDEGGSRMSQLQPVGPASADLLEDAAAVVEPKRWGPVVASVLVALAIAVLFIRVVPDGVVTTFRMAGGQG